MKKIISPEDKTFTTLNKNSNIYLQILLRKIAEILMFAHKSEDLVWVDNFTRASGNVICQFCSFEYWRHATHPLRTYLNILCNNRSVKL